MNAQHNASTTPSTVTLLEELTSRGSSVYAAHLERPGGRPQLMILERFSRAASGAVSGDVIASIRHLKRLLHSNLPRIKELRETGDPIEVVSEFIEGERLSGLGVPADAPTLPLNIQLHVLLDVLRALKALHELRDASGQPIGLVHGDVAPATVIVGLDGVSRLTHACRLTTQSPRERAELLGYVAPEVLSADKPVDARADLYSVGVMLWECLQGQRLFSETTAAAVLARQKSGKLQRVTLPKENAWAAPLIDVVARALQFAPEGRFASAEEMASEIRRVARQKPVSIDRIASSVDEVSGAKIRARRKRFIPVEATKTPVAPPPGASGFRSLWEENEPLEVTVLDSVKTAQLAAELREQVRDKNTTKTNENTAPVPQKAPSVISPVHESDSPSARSFIPAQLAPFEEDDEETLLRPSAISSHPRVQFAPYGSVTHPAEPNVFLTESAMAINAEHMPSEPPEEISASMFRPHDDRRRFIAIAAVVVASIAGFASAAGIKRMSGRNSSSHSMGAQVHEPAPAPVALPVALPPVSETPASTPSTYRATVAASDASIGASPVESLPTKPE